LIISELFNQAIHHHQAGQLPEAEVLYRQILAADPLHADSLHLLGVIAYQTGHLEMAMEMIHNAISLNSDVAAFHSNLGNVFKDLGRFDEAAARYKQALAITPSFPEALFNLGNTLKDQGKMEEACECYYKALDIRPTYAEAYSSLGVALEAQGKLETAIDCYRQALAIKPDFPEALCDLASALQTQGQLDEAIAHYKHALAIKADFPAALFNLGNAHQEQGHLDEAIACYKQALLFKPDFPEALFNMGNVFKDQGELDAAIACYEQALLIKPSFEEILHNLLFVLNYHPDKSAEEIFAAYRDYDDRFGTLSRKYWRRFENSCEPCRRLRVGYVSPDFRLHSTRHFLEPLLACHDKSVVEVYAYAELTQEDTVTTRYKAYVDHWIPTASLSDEELTERIRTDGIDILVDLAGHTNHNRLQVFARKPAPVSVTWLGYGYTTGLKAIDYILTDEACTPLGSESLFSETPWRLETPGLVYRPDPETGAVNLLPAITKGHITFGTLTRNIRLNHLVVQAWSEILNKVENSRLIVDSKSFGDRRMQEKLVSQFSVHGISPKRLEIGFHSPPWDTLRKIDISLDCFPHNSGTTLFESLYLGVPFVTLAGRAGVGRLGSSILEGVGHPEWIAHSPAEYIQKAIALASDLPALARQRLKLRDEMATSPLMKEEAFARNVETAYRAMFAQWSIQNQGNQASKRAQSDNDFAG